MIERTINLHPVGMYGANYLGNPNLNPEINYQMDLSYKNKLNLNTNWFRKFSFEATIFQSFLKNYIVAQTSKIKSNKEIINVKQFVNIDQAYKVGFELLWNLDFINNWSLGGNINYIYTENKDWNEAIALTPPFENHLRLQFNHSRFNASLEHQFVNHQNKVAYTFNEKPSKSYHLINLNSSFKFSKKINAILRVDNLLDKYYQSHLNFNYKNQVDLPIMERMANPGRNIILMIQYQF